MAKLYSSKKRPDCAASGLEDKVMWDSFFRSAVHAGCRCQFNGRINTKEM